MDWKKIAWSALGVAVISYLLSWLYNYAKVKVPALANGIATVTFAAVDVNVGSRISSGLDTSVAGKFLGAHLGAFGGFQQWILLFISAFAIILVGMWINKGLEMGKTENSKFAFELTFGAVAIGLVFGYMSSGAGGIALTAPAAAAGTAFAYGIYFLIVAAIYSGLRNAGAKNVLPTPV